MREDIVMGEAERARSTRRLDGDLMARMGVEPIFDPSARLQPMVMVIDDSRAVRKVVEISLSRQGISAISFPGGIQAIAALANGEIAPPKILLLDIGMPRMDGWEVARRLRSNRSFEKSQIFMLSGHDGVFNRAKAGLFRAGFIAKPFKSPELVRTVCAALGMSVPEERW